MNKRNSICSLGLMLKVLGEDPTTELADLLTPVLQEALSNDFKKQTKAQVLDVAKAAGAEVENSWSKAKLVRELGTVFVDKSDPLIEFDDAEMLLLASMYCALVGDPAQILESVLITALQDAIEDPWHLSGADFQTLVDLSAVNDDSDHVAQLVQELVNGEAVELLIDDADGKIEVPEISHRTTTHGFQNNGLARGPLGPFAVIASLFG